MISFKLWDEFAGRHLSYRHLARPTLLVLPHAVTAAIVGRIPEFFTDADVAFEWDLAWTVPLGFQFQIPIDDRTYANGLWAGGFGDDSLNFPPLPTRPAQGQPPPAAAAGGPVTPEITLSWAPELQRQNAAAEELHESLKGFLDERAAPPRSDLMIRQHALARQREAERLRRHAEGYVVWLTTNPDYRRELAELRAKHEATIVRERGFPRRRPRRVSPVEWALHRPLVNAVSPWGARVFGTELLRDFHSFYRRWSLDTLLTWDLPLPLELEACAPGEGGWTPTGEEGLNVILPWPLLRQSDVDLDKIIARYAYLNSPPHLRGWMEKRAAQGDAGEAALQQQFQLYWCWKLVLEDRYPERMMGKVGLMDQVFEGLMGKTEGGDTVKKRRRSLERGLNAARDAAIGLGPERAAASSTAPT